MNASETDQQALLELADIDRRTAAAQHRASNPPEAARVKELIAERSALLAELVSRREAVDAANTEVARLEADIATTKNRRERDLERMGQQSDAKTAAGFEHEIASLDNRIARLEDAELEAMERAEEASAALAEQQALIDAITAEGQQLSTQAKDAIADAKDELERLSGDRRAITVRLPEPLLAQYERLAQRGVAAGHLQHGTCGACQMVLSSTDLNALRALPTDEVANCPECGAILVRTEVSGL